MTALPETDAILMIASSEGNADMLYAVGMFVPDPFTYIERDGRRTVVMSDLEIDRAKAQAKVDEVLSFTAYQNRLKERGAEQPKFADVVAEVLNEKRIRSVLVPEAFPVGYADRLREHGITVHAKADPFWAQRTMKNAHELSCIAQASRHTESAMRAAIAVIREATVRDGLLYGPEGVLTAEYVKKVISIHLLERECIAQHTIVAGGLQGCDPHNQGAGPLRAGEPIILDVFPKSSTTGYYADITRTVIRGRASDALKRMYDAVLEAQEVVFARLKAGIDGQEIHRAVEALFKSRGFETGEKDGRMQGFFHGTGHGLGLEVHEPPRISKVPCIMRPGHVVTVEPGLYYTDTGGVRIEDNVVVTENGCENLTQMEKRLEV
jgi:Xaa-Pro aminopeptidase